MNVRISSRTPAALLAALIALAAPAAQASVCCMTTGIFGVGRLGLWEQSAAGLRTTGADTLGAWSADGRWRPNPQGWVDSELRLDVYGLLRLTERGQIHAMVPIFENRRGLDDEVVLAGGLGDLELGVRYEVLTIGEHEGLPALGLTASLLLPSGVRPEEAEQEFDADATGRGALGASGAVSIEESFGKAFVRADLGGTLYAPFVRVDLRQTQRYGPTLAAAASGGGAVLDGLLLGVMAGVVHDLPIVLGDEEEPDSAATSASAGVLASWAIDPHWTLLANASSGLFVDALGQNRPGRISASIGVRYAYF